MIDKVTSEKLRKMDIFVDYKVKGEFFSFSKRHAGERILLLCDRKTKKYADSFSLSNSCICLIDEDEPVPDETTCGIAIKKLKGCDFILAVGSGTLNDVAKYAAMCTNKKSGVLATAPSMDGYASPVAAVINDGFKVSKQARVPTDILVDENILKDAPHEMIAAGAADILGKTTCLTDWRLAQYHKGERVNEMAFFDMVRAVDGFIASLNDIVLRNADGIEKLMDALIVSGLAMAEAGNSRPASGAEHHISHYLEMWFIAQKKRIPLHGIKVGLGTLVSAYLYRALERDGVTFLGDVQAYKAAKQIPSVEKLQQILNRLGALVRFSNLGISRELFRETIRCAHKVRDRFTILTLVNELRLTERYLPELEEQFF